MAVSGPGWCPTVAGALALLALLPSIAAEGPAAASTPPVVTFYAHWIDIVNRAPMNTVPPDPALEHDLNEGFEMPTVVVHSPCGEPCDLNFQNNVLTMFTLPAEFQASGSGVSYDTRDPAYEVRLGDGPIVAVLYLSAHPVPSQNSGSALGSLTNAGTMPLVQVEAQWETGRHAGAGTVIARGITSQYLQMMHVPGGDPVYEVHVPMGRFIDTIPSGGLPANPTPGTTLSVQLHQLVLPTGEVLQPDWRLRTGPKYPWRLEVPLENPLLDRGLQTWILGDDLHALWTVKAAWGSYDLDRASFRLHIDEGRDGPLDLAPDSVEYSAFHDRDLRSVKAGWVIPLSHLHGPGPWSLRAHVDNRQHTANLEASATDRAVLFAGRNEAPGLPPLFAAGAALSALVLWRRRA